MSNDQTTGTAPNADQLIAQIVANVLLGKIRIRPDQPEPRYLQPVRELARQVRRTVGERGMTTLSQEMNPAIHALADMLFDAVIGVESNKTLDALKKVPVTLRTMIEQIAAALTGRTDPRGRWDDSLWDLHESFGRMLSLSVTGITEEEMRAAFDPILHAVVDEIILKKFFTTG